MTKDNHGLNDTELKAAVLFMGMVEFQAICDNVDADFDEYHIIQAASLRDYCTDELSRLAEDGSLPVEFLNGTADEFGIRLMDMCLKRDRTAQDYFREFVAPFIDCLNAKYERKGFKNDIDEIVKEYHENMMERYDSCFGEFQQAITEDFTATSILD